MRNFLFLALATLVLAACGGGGSGSELGGSSGSGGGGSSGSGSSGSGPSSYDQAMSTATAANVQTVVLDQGPAALAAANIGSVNTIFTSVQICAPGSSTNCQVIDHVQVDTGSSGLRIVSSVLNSTLYAALVQQTLGGEPLYECVGFVDGYSWGPIFTADLHIGGTTTNSGETAASIPVQIIGGGSTSATPPASCAGSDTSFSIASDTPPTCNASGATALPEEDTVACFGANGIIGVGSFPQDCGTSCTQASGSLYYTCPAGANCTPTGVPLNQQVPNPVASFTTDNNGVVIQLPSIPASGQTLVAGTLTFGIGTQSNNALGSATVLAMDPNYGYFTTDFDGSTFSDSYIDSGSNALYINNSTIPQCSSTGDAQYFLCPSSTLSESATNTGVNGATTTVSFSIANAETLFNNQYAAYDDLAGTDPVQSTTDNQAFGWGVPFFFGRTVFTSIGGSGVGDTDNPIVAY